MNGTNIGNRNPTANATAIANSLPRVPDGFVVVGAVKITTDASTVFTPGTTALDASGITPTFTNLSGYPDYGITVDKKGLRPLLLCGGIVDNDSVASIKRAENGWVLCVKVPSGEEYAMMDQHRMAVFTTVADLTAFLGSVLDSIRRLNPKMIWTRMKCSRNHSETP